jgi:cysteine sulfinate desulfinase/cysteine desulfurase-like protein
MQCWRPCPARRSTANAAPCAEHDQHQLRGVEAESLLIALDLEGIAVSTGSACSSGTLEPSHVLRAMGLPTHRTQNSIRISLGRGIPTPRSTPFWTS